MTHRYRIGIEGVGRYGKGRSSETGATFLPFQNDEQLGVGPDDATVSTACWRPLNVLPSSTHGRVPNTSSSAVEYRSRRNGW